MKCFLGIIGRAPLGRVVVLVSMLGVAACGGGGGGGGGGGLPPPATTPPAATTLSITIGIKQLQFSWVAATGATYYRLLQNPDGASGYTQVGGNIATTSTTLDVSVHSHNWASALYMVEACNSGGCSAGSNIVNTLGSMLQAIGYFKASNTGPSDFFGHAVAVSGDGNIVAVGAGWEDSVATGIDGGQGDDANPSDPTDLDPNFGAVYVYARNAGVWSQQAYVKPSTAVSHARFGYSVSLNHDGTTLAVGGFSNKVNIYTRSGTTWSQQAQIQSSNVGGGDGFGTSLSLSSDGNTLAVGASGEDSDGNGDNDNLESAGATYVFTRTLGSWSEQAFLKASNPDEFDQFGVAVALSGDGDTLVVGASGEDSLFTGINGGASAEADDSSFDSSNPTAASPGAVYVFTRSILGVWSKQAYIKASNTGTGDSFGSAVTVSSDGNTLAVGARGEDSNATGINPGASAEADNSASNAGAAYVFSRSGSTWTQQAYVKGSNTDASDRFGYAVALSSDSNTLVVGATDEGSTSSGVNGSQTDSGANFGAAYVFTRSSGVWSQHAYVKASNTDVSEPRDQFGWSVAVNSDGTTVAVGANQEDSNATGVGGTQTNNLSSDSGAVYLY